jgi:hypothetical protein
MRRVRVGKIALPLPLEGSSDALRSDVGGQSPFNGSETGSVTVYERSPGERPPFPRSDSAANDIVEIPRERCSPIGAVE